MSEASRPTPQEFEKVLAAASTAQASFEEENLPLSRRIQRFLHLYPTTVPFVVLLLGLLLGCTVNYSHFVTGSNLSTVLTQVTIIGILGIAQTLVILTAGIDLSVGVIMVISSVVMGRLAVVDGVPILIAFPLGLICGLLCGWLNGSLVTRMQMPPFIVTLGTLSIIGALNTFYSQSETIREQDIEEKAPFLQLMGIPFNVGSARIILASFLLIALAIVFWYVLNRTAYGRHIYATGDDPEAARLAGINTDGILLSVYTLAGLISAIAGWALIGRIGAISPTAGANGNLDSITAVVIGGTSLFGGRGSIIGTLIGALIVGVFRSAVSLAGLDVLWQEFAIGVLIIVAVALDQWIRRVSK
ncbi:ABC transporter permease [Roseiarcus sp.]|jgi:fructose transport system permease protein|uniref:ABC transporter permease n=1 Tax=Roseiarcus sp. TaxID=1969460 RepID=UPI003D13318A